ncbi:PepSY domain-containing protein [Sporolactobacillus sp. STSJ-5]|uniref:PepSY domain-containing protein n=1 Tax=Sporolactobacillus sp. STSJ-5 TaxID=2965076 RepID=UPI002106F649|nr:PepSY domain-containing protein [Sporolactobacillus sp. STSJ-5]MCQ2009300.1 PepSY domain-containing protein [Sporolactobacillus sp. STSJ-5]
MNRRKKMLLLFSMIALILLTVALIQFLQREQLLPKNKIRTLAVHQLGGKVSSAVLEEKRYVVTLDRNNGRYRVIMDAESGKIVQLSIIKAPSSSDRYTITEEDAKTIAVKQVPGNVQSIEKVSENGKAAYSVAIQTASGTVHTIIDAANGSVLNTQQPSKDGLETVISEQEARSIALKQVDGEIVHSELEENEDQYEYKVTIKTKQDTAEVYVNAYSGKTTVSWDSENEDEDEEDEDEPDEDE